MGSRGRIYLPMAGWSRDHLPRAPAEENDEDRAEPADELCKDATWRSIITTTTAPTRTTSDLRQEVELVGSERLDERHLEPRGRAIDTWTRDVGRTLSASPPYLCLHRISAVSRLYLAPSPRGIPSSEWLSSPRGRRNQSPGGAARSYRAIEASMSARRRRCLRARARRLRTLHRSAERSICVCRVSGAPHERRGAAGSRANSARCTVEVARREEEESIDEGEDRK